MRITINKTKVRYILRQNRKEVGTEEIARDIKRVSEKYITFTNLTRCLSIISFAFEIYVMQRSIYIL
jgi:hypothetical protein